MKEKISNQQRVLSAKMADISGRQVKVANASVVPPYSRKRAPWAGQWTAEEHATWAEVTAGKKQKSQARQAIIAQTRLAV